MCCWIWRVAFYLTFISASRQYQIAEDRTWFSFTHRRVLSCITVYRGFIIIVIVWSPLLLLAIWDTPSVFRGKRCRMRRSLNLPSLFEFNQLRSFYPASLSPPSTFNSGRRIVTYLNRRRLSGFSLQLPFQWCSFPRFFSTWFSWRFISSASSNIGIPLSPSSTPFKRTFAIYWFYYTFGWTFHNLAPSLLDTRAIESYSSFFFLILLVFLFLVRLILFLSCKFHLIHMAQMRTDP